MEVARKPLGMPNLQQLRQDLNYVVRADRWMKVGHIPAAFKHSPLFVLRNSYKMLSHTFAGSSLRSILGLEDEQKMKGLDRANRRGLLSPTT